MSPMEYEQAVTDKALELVGNEVSPHFNIWPTRELVKQVWAQGFDLVKVPGPANSAPAE